MGAFEATLKYAQERFTVRQADRFVSNGADLPRQDACQRDRMSVPDGRLARMDDDGKLRGPSRVAGERRSARRSRAETISWGQEVLGGNGIADYNVALLHGRQALALLITEALSGAGIASLSCVAEALNCLR